MRYCVNCLLPDTKPDLWFNKEGLCAACISFSSRSEIDWDERESDFINLVRSASEKTKSQWDCVIPVSGGKDSTFQALTVKRLGFNPLCVVSTTCSLTDVGRLNIENLSKLGVDLIEFSPNPNVRKKLNKIGLQTVGDISWPEHVGIFTIPVQIAVKFGIKILVWGENSQNEYGGPEKAQKSIELDRNWLEEFGGLLGLRINDMKKVFGFTEEQLAPYKYPDPDSLEASGVKGVFLGQYFPWDGMKNAMIATMNGFKTYHSAIEGSAVNYENLDNYQAGIHDYFKYLKFGFGRATDLVSNLIRRGILDRQEGLEVVRARDGAFPHTYLGRSLSEILKEIDMEVPEFHEICDKFTNKELFLVDKDLSYVRKKDGSPIKINYDNA